MKILFLGDIVGKRGREIIRDLLPLLKEKYLPDLIIANGENAAHGKGITIKIYNELLSYGIDYITMGNHTFSKKEIIDHLDEMNKLICPYNYINKLGKGYRTFKTNDKKICIINLLGQVMQEEYATSPYKAMDKILKDTLYKNIDLYIVDYHGETTAEKRVFFEYYKDKINAVLGTHTHIQTADEQIIDGKAFISDVGMCGPYNSIIGRDIDECIRKLIFNEQTRFTVSLNDPILCGIYIDFNDINNICTSIERIQIRPKV